MAKKMRKNTTVTLLYEGNPKLGGWVSKQRHFYHYNELHPKRYALLNSIDFNLDGRSKMKGKVSG